jgi:hypothetical protein
LRQAHEAFRFRAVLVAFLWVSGPFFVFFVVEDVDDAGAAPRSRAIV